MQAPSVLIEVGEALCELRPVVRLEALARLDELYVSCADGVCVTHPDVARAVLPYALRALRDPDPEVRITGARAIELLASDAREVIPELADALSDPVVTVRVAILEAIGEFGHHAALVAESVNERLALATTREERLAATSALVNLDAAPLDDAY